MATRPVAAAPAPSDKINTEAFSLLWEISQLLNTGLDRESLFLSIQLLEQNVNPEALAAVIKELTREAQAIQVRATGCTRRRRQRGAERTLSFVRRLYIK